MCKVTGHCEIETTISECGNPTVIGANGESMYNSLFHDTFQATLIYVTAFVSILILLISQMVALDTSHFTFEDFSYHYRLRKVHGKRMGIKNHSNIFEVGVGRDQNQGSDHVSKTANLVDEISKYIQNMFTNDVKDLPSSGIFATCAIVQFACTILLFVTFCFYAFTGKEWYSFVFLFLALLGSSVEIVDLEREVLTNASDEVNSQVQK
jgi:hypothetical protein